MNREIKIARALLEIRAVTLQPNDYFRWTSGIRSPIYCDNRLTMSHPTVRARIADEMGAMIQAEFKSVTMIAGTATAGIPHAAWVSERLNLPMIYVRDAQKKHGKTNQIEGDLTMGKQVVIIEDLISTGISSLTVTKVLQEAGCQVLGVVAIFSYELKKAQRAFEKQQIPYRTLTTYTHLLEVAVQNGMIQPEEVATLKKWRDELST